MRQNFRRKRDKLKVLANRFGLSGPEPRRPSVGFDKPVRHTGPPASLGAEFIRNGREQSTQNKSVEDLQQMLKEGRKATKGSGSEGEDQEPQSIWHKAWASLLPSHQQLIESVMKKNKKNYDATKDVFGDLEGVAQQRMQEIHERQWNENNPLAGKRAVRVRAVTSRIIVCLRRFKEVGDIAVSFDPVHAALPWAAFRFVLEVLTVDDEQLELLFDGLERVSFFGLRVRGYEGLYLSGSRDCAPEAVAQLEHSLVQLCKEMLTFMAVAIKRLDQDAVTRTIGGIFDPAAASNLLNSINFRASQADIEASICERYLSLEDRKKLHDLVTYELDNIDARVDEMWVRLADNERSKLLQWLSPIHYATDHDFARKGRVADTGSWLLGLGMFKQWENSDVSQIFWLHGIPGAGKTKLSSRVVDHTVLRLHQTRNKETLVYFYCDRNRSDHRDPASITRSFIRQLSADMHNAADICKVVDEHWRLERRKGFPSKELPFETCKEFLPKLISAHTKTVMVLDGLDECDKESRHELLRLVDDLVNDPNCFVKVFISSREDRDLVESFFSRTNLRVEASDNHDDIKAYVASQLENSSNSWFREKLPPVLKAKILQTFSDKSDGMFQWAVLQMHDLLQLKRASDVETYLGSLPKGLMRAYQKILQDIGGQAGSAPIVAARTFRWIMDSACPLHPDELVAAVCQSSNGLVSHGPDINIWFILEACHNLVVVTGSTCRFAHLSIQEYLESHDWPNKPSDRLLGDVCLHLLMPSEDASATVVNTLSNYADGYWYRHVENCDPGGCEAESATAPLLARFLGDPTDSSCHYRAWVDRMQAWSTNIDASDLEPTHLAAFGAVSLGLLATATRWIEDGTLDPKLSTPRQCLLHLAVKSGNLAMCRYLLESGADVNHSTRVLGTPLLQSVSERHYAITELLVRHPDIEIDKGRHNNGASALCSALAMGDYNKPVELLLRAGADPNIMKGGAVSQGSEYNGFMPALHIAAAKGANDMVRILVAHKAEPNLVAGIYETPLLNAVYLGHEDTMHCLIECGADVNLLRPLYRTFSTGNDATISSMTMALVDYGALDHVLNLAPAERTQLDEQFSDAGDWLDERLARIDASRESRRLMRISSQGGAGGSGKERI